MADFGSPVADQLAYNPQSALQNVSALMGIRQQKANIQTSEAQAQQTQQDAVEKAAAAHFIQNYDPDKHLGPNGVVDLNNIADDPDFKALGSHAPAMWNLLTQLRGQQIQNVQALSNLDKDTREQLGQGMGQFREVPEVINDTPQGRKMVSDYLVNFGKQGPEQQRIADMFGNSVMNSPQGRLQESVSRMQLQSMSAGTQATAQAPGYQDTGTKLVQTNPLAAGGSAYGKPDDGSINKDIAGATTATAQAKTDNDVANADTAMADNSAANKSILDNMRKISYTTPTGPGQAQIAEAESFLGQHIPGLQGAADDATKYQVLNKYAYQLALNMAKQNYGAGTDQQNDAVAHGLPNPNNMTPEALRQTISFIDGQVQLGQARSALASNYKKSHNGSTSGYQQIHSEFMQNVDPRMFNYIGLKDKASQQQWIKQTFGDDKAAIADFARKMQTIQSLGGFDYMQGQK